MLPPTAPPLERNDRSRSSTGAVHGVQDTDRTSMPPIAPGLNFAASYESVRALSFYFKITLLPLCNDYVRNIPSDRKSREFEHKKLSETILAQVLLKADRLQANDETTRVARRKLIKEAQSTLDKLDDALRDYTYEHEL